MPKKSIFTEELADFRNVFLKRLINVFENNSRIAGVIILGSGAVGFEDIYSDLDLCIVVNHVYDLPVVYDAFKIKLFNLYKVIQSFELVGIKGSLFVSLLDNYLEVDCGFVALENLRATSDRWKICFDHSGKIETIMSCTYKGALNRDDIQKEYSRKANSIWYHIIKAVIAIERKQPWKALYELETIRNITIDLRGLRDSIETKDFKCVDKLQSDFLAEMEQTLSPSLKLECIMNALKHAINNYLKEAEYLDGLTNTNKTAELKENLKGFLSEYDFI